MKKLLIFLLTFCLTMSLAACGGSSEPATKTNTANTEEPAPAADPEPEPEPEPNPYIPPDPATYFGSGDDVIEMEPYEDLYVFRIEGNAGGNHFSVTTYDKNGEYLDLLVNTTEPYSGVCIDPSQTTAMFEIKATGDWSITVDSIATVPQVPTGSGIAGKGDAVFITDGFAKIAEISGNSSGNHFAVIAYGNRGELLVNTTDSYSGKVMVDTKNDAGVYEVKCESEWEIKLS